MIPVIDLFAGPGGLNEGFSRVVGVGGGSAFKTVASFEMDPYACQTLALRTALRLMKYDGDLPKDYYRYLQGVVDWNEFVRMPRVTDALAKARSEVHQIELGPATRRHSDALIERALKAQVRGVNDPWVLIGGPPCQAYSLAGRARRTNDAAFEDDKKHFLFREYLHILTKFRPTVFVMENVKGLLSSTHGGHRMFDRILRDLAAPQSGPGYEIRSLVVRGTADTLRPEDFVIRAERYGVPQRRHRVILLGVRKDLAPGIPSVILAPSEEIDVRAAIGDLPKLRSGISPRTEDNWRSWARLRAEAQELAATSLGGSRRWFDSMPLTTGSVFMDRTGKPEADTPYHRWVADPSLDGVIQHISRRHMERDLVRYGYLSRVAEVHKRIHKLSEIPAKLAPAHKNVGRPDTPFADRFRVQLWGAPATTIVSHISKDGHYYIHPDSEQMRSLTVREAARIQSFPDNYVFMGSRTHQYQQVGNAVPPLLAARIAKVVAGMLGIARTALDSDTVESL